MITTVEQLVTLSGDTMVFGEVDLSVPNEEVEQPTEEVPTEPEPTIDTIAIGENAILGAVADGKAINLYADSTFKFEHEMYNPNSAENAVAAACYCTYSNRTLFHKCFKDDRISRTGRRIQTMIKF